MTRVRERTEYLTRLDPGLPLRTLDLTRALLGANWGKLTVSTPPKTNDSKVTGDGWASELKNGYAVEKIPSTNNYSVKKK